MVEMVNSALRYCFEYLRMFDDALLNIVVNRREIIVPWISDDTHLPRFEVKTQVSFILSISSVVTY